VLPNQKGSPLATSALPSHRLRFDDFEVDLRSGELWKSGKRVRLQDQPFQVLCALLQRQGEIVPREELKQTLWPADTFVDFDDGLNTAVRKIRDVLGDSAEKPRYVETIPRRGYRFVGQLADVRPVVLPSPVEESKAGPEKENARLRPSAHADLQTQKALSSVRWRVLLAGVAVLVVLHISSTPCLSG
jgi:DNA-binding winged helix-turn-helix (wHTH) protein